MPPEVNLIDSPGHVDFTSEAPIFWLRMRSSFLKSMKSDEMRIYIYDMLFNTVSVYIVIDEV